MPKTFEELYLSSYMKIATRQKEKYGNPIGEPSTARVCTAIRKLSATTPVTVEQERKLIQALAKLDYGEWGLTVGRVGAALDKIFGHNRLPWQIKGQFEIEVCQ